MEIHCKNCGRLIPPANLNTQTGIAVCPNCEAVFDFSDQMPEKPHSERLLKTPTLFTVDEHEGRITIAYRWFSWRAPIYLSSGLLLTGVPVLMLSVLGGAGQPIHPLWLLVMVLIGLFGAGLTYYSLAQFINRTVIDVHNGVLRVLHRPVPLPGNLHLTDEQIAAVVIYERSRQTDYGKIAVYDVTARLQDNSLKYIVRGLAEEEQARFLEYQITRYLKRRIQSIPSNSVTA